MLTMLVFKSIFQMIAFYGIIFAILGTIGFFVYQNAVKTRKFYKCPNCKETFRTEHMDAQICKVCGTNLELLESENVTDKTF